MGRPATNKQLWALFCATKEDHRNKGLTLEQASELLSKINENKPDYKAIWDEACATALKAMRDCIPEPMIVQQHKHVLDDNSPVTKQWDVPEGVCGFAWVNVKGTTGFARWAKKNIGEHQFPDFRKAYKRGYSIGPPREAGQSYERKCAWAGAFARVLESHSIEAYMSSRLD